MIEGNTTRTTDTTPVVRVCPLCAGTGRRRIRRPGTPRRATTLVDCTCAATKETTCPTCGSDNPDVMRAACSRAYTPDWFHQTKGTTP